MTMWSATKYRKRFKINNRINVNMMLKNYAYDADLSSVSKSRDQYIEGEGAL